MRRALVRRSIAAAAGAAALFVSGAGLADAPQPHVSIEFGDYAPARIDVVAGDEVNWSNDSVRNHTVTDDHGAYDSGSLHAGSQFNHVFAHAGSFPYHCRLHSYIRGEVDVYDLLLAPEPVPAQADQPFPLRGRSALPPDTAVSVEADEGTGYRAVASTTVGPHGDFTATVTPTASATYRAVAGSEQSPPVQLLVLNHDIAAVAHNGRRSSVVSVTVSPADPGATVVLQLHLKERFGWWPVASARLGKSSTARFVLHTHRRVAARARLTLPDGATPLATSPTVRVGSVAQRTR